ncbi:RWD-domain-containing protein [Macroventuria anomochaeta]|uniref:RWD-domain-containing protein n=1 Tax=Macroventuria anomochaeta TaxID=301207 RepID=A0ACB6SFI6_9PLEO|nr:RWD-domain-containing protein [Macroventuria anomochaeta]KAF2632247.1 RWD-domain-containing protein [Macroventuria anomochaeta]
MGVEDQKEEREVLESIFPDEITDVSETEFRVSIVLDVTPGDEDPADLEGPTIILNVQYPPSYPDEAPRLDLTQPPNAPKHPYLDIQDDKQRLLDSLSETIEENLGMAMIFTLVTVLKDSAELLISERQNAKQALADMEAAKVEEEENRKFQGEAVTRESFLKWREEFRREMEERKKKEEEEREAEDKKKRIVKEERKLTGKELWQQGLAGKGDEEDEEGDDLQGMKDLKVSASS